MIFLADIKTYGKAKYTTQTQVMKKQHRQFQAMIQMIFQQRFIREI